MTSELRRQFMTARQYLAAAIVEIDRTLALADKESRPVREERS